MRVASPRLCPPAPALRKFIWSLSENQLEVAASQTLEPIPG
jgi:hypothetical protein